MAARTIIAAALATLFVGALTAVGAGSPPVSRAEAATPQFVAFVPDVRITIVKTRVVPIADPAPVKSSRLVAAIIHVESLGDPNATGKAGEIGLMQIKCQTARGIGFKGKCRDLYKPSVNRHWGSKYLAIALRRAGGDHCRAASLYNMGVNARPRCTAYGRKVLQAMR